jgi:hypothetical protein
MKYRFEREHVNGLILVHITLDEKHVFKMMLDTGASHTTFDFNPLYIANYPVTDIIGTDIVETASGMMEVDIIQTKAISAFGLTVRNMKVQMYDFLKRGVLSEYDGMLGLDFFENTEFRINMKNQTIEVIKN